MMLVLAEKPSAARNFATALGGMSGSYQGQPYRIFALRGHVLTHDEPKDQVRDELRESYARWSLEDMPWDASEIAFTKSPKGNGCAELLAKLSYELKGVCEVAIATDNDPSGEGELIAWEALEWCRWEGKTTRMRFADEAPTSVRAAFERREAIPSMEEDGDFVKALCRARWDFLSMQLVRGASCIARSRGFRPVVRQGRLKSVMVALVGEQAAAVAAHVRRPFFEARFKDASGNSFAREKPVRVEASDPALLDGLHASEVDVDSCTRRSTPPGRLLDLAGITAALAREGHRPAAVLETYQRMYEAQVASYPRTEDKKITPEQFAELAPLADSIARVVGVDPALLTHRQPRATHVEEGGAHGANRPGPTVPESMEALSSFGPEAPAIYDLLAKSFLATLAPDFEYDLIRAHVADFPDFLATAKVPVSPGFKAVFDAEAAAAEASDEPPEAVKAFEGPASPFIFEGASPRPPKPTMKWLNKRLERHAVGTGATRASTLADISADGAEDSLLKESKGALSLTRCGEVSFALLDGCMIASPEATERLFAAMELVGAFEADPQDVLATATDTVAHDLACMSANAPRLDAMGLAEDTVLCKCPRCGADVVARAKLATCSTNKAEKDEGGTYVPTAGCGFKVFRRQAGKELSDSQLARLIKTGRTNVIKGFKKKAGGTFDTALILKEDGSVGFAERKAKAASTRKRKWL